jgi:cytochrome c-type biogenesis protein CcmF
MEYIGEHLWPGQLGNLLLVFSFTSAILACVAYFKSANADLESITWKRLARFAFRAHAFFVFSSISLLFYIITQHYFEYQYAWQHSSKELPMRYMLSCFWEGQEGSFLLWSFWHCVIGLILQFTARDWESSVMTVVTSVQVFLASMLLGVYIFDYHLGSNPFLLLREHPQFSNMPFVKIPTYLQTLDGRGLNPLLQNYWMTIHPPTLFLGFASTVVPFAYAIAGLWQKQFTAWLKPSLPWTLFGVMILGTGILMGGAWAYESLSFGGFWAWDPVENASLVPWLTFVSALHVMLIVRARNHSVGTAAVLCIATFILILYSTFLTRSGILGDTSVHAFTDLGMSGQLLVYMLFFTLLPAFLILNSKKSILIYVINIVGFIYGITFGYHFNYSQYIITIQGFGLVFFNLYIIYSAIPNSQNEEESITSREFWMILGTLVLVVSAFQIISTTSIPVFNKLFNTKIAPPSKPIEHYNSWQVPIAALLSLLIAITQYFNYKNTGMDKFWKALMRPLVISIVVTIIGIFYLQLYTPFYVVLFFGALFAVIANIDYMIRFGKSNFLKSGASISHVGFALVLLGALVSTSKSLVISQNTSGTDISKLGKDFSNNDNILLRERDTLQMGKYLVTYSAKRKEGVNHYFDIDYFERNEKGKPEKKFTLSPLVQVNPRMGNVAEPDTRHYLTSDVYTHITYADMSQFDEQKNDFKEGKKNTVKTGDTIFASNSIIVVDGLFKDVDKAKYKLEENDIAVGAHLLITDISNHTYEANPVFVIRGSYLVPVAEEIKDLGLKFEFTSLNTDNGKVDIVVYEKNKSDNFIIMKAIIFPFINILWIGCLVMIVGISISILQRVRRTITI